MTDSGETDTEVPWVRIRIGIDRAGHVGRADHDGTGGNGETLTIRVSNAYDARVDHTRSNAPGFGDHGWGMRIVDQIARQQHGTFTHGVGEDLRHGPCWYAIATLACTAKPDLISTTPASPSNPAAPASLTDIAGPADSADHANPAFPVDPATSAAIPAARAAQTATQTTPTTPSPQQTATAKDRP